ncbi:hypothetical protein MC885_019531 [Smutsia gigantea]|nr:hypothetical protein MC885_019531 [Smutsia gigantea]
MLKLCNSQACPQGSADFRALQCAEFNSHRFRGWHYKWKPYTHVADLCGVCKGNNSDCMTHKGLYAKHHRTNQYYQMLTIPPGARSIRIYEMNVSTSYISARNALRRYYLNGHWAVDWPGRYKFSGTSFDYRRSYKEPESLTSAGPTNETLIVELLFQGRNPGIAWEYSLPRLGREKKPSTQPSYTWAVTRSECSVSCGGGRSLVTCLLEVGLLACVWAMEHIAHTGPQDVLLGSPGLLPEGGGTISRGSIECSCSSGVSLWKPDWL